MKKVASLKYGVVFKKAFCDPEIFTAFIRDMIGLNVTIEHVETEKEFDPPIGYIKPRFDLFAEDVSHRVIVDIQHARTTDHDDRFLYYHCVALLEQIANSENYRPPLKVFTIVVLTSGDRHHADVAVTDFDPHDLQGRPLGEIPHKIFYVSPKYLTAQTPEPYREWLQAIQDTLDEEVDESQYHLPAIRKLFEQIEQAQISPEERARMIDEYHQEELQATQFEEGKLEGKNEEKHKIAQALLQKGIALDVIAETTGLSRAELLTLQERP